MAIRAYRRQPSGFLKIMDPDSGQGMVQLGQDKTMPNGQEFMAGERWKEEGTGDGLQFMGRGRPGRGAWGDEDRMPAMGDLGRGEMAVDAELPQRGYARGPGNSTINLPGAGGGGGSMMEDRDGNGIPDGAEMKRVVRREGPLGEMMTEEARWKHRVAPRGAAELMDTGLGEMDVTRMSGLNPSEKSKRQDWRAGMGRMMEAERGRAGALDVANREAGASDRNAWASLLGAEAQAEGGVRAARSTAAGRVMESRNELAGKQLEVDEMKRQWDAKRGEQPQVKTLEDGTEVVYFNGAMLRVGGRTAGGRVVYAEETGPDGSTVKRAVGVIGDDGRAVTLPAEGAGGGGGSDGGDFAERLRKARQGELGK